MSDLLKEYERYLIINRSLTPNTISAYMSDIEEFISKIDKNPLEVESMDILSYLANFSNKRTLNRKLSSINSFYDFCHREIDEDIEKPSIPMAKLPSTLPKYMSYEAIMERLGMIERDDFVGRRDRALILFLYATGCRVSEALMCKREDISREGWLRIRYAKGQKQRVVPIAKVALEALDRYLEISDISSPYIWLNYKGDRLSRVSAFKICKKWLGVSPHVLRHSYATALITGGADIRVVQDLLGHSSALTTQIYTHIENAQLLDTIMQYHPMK